MHPNPIFRQTDAKRSLDFARARGFGVLAISTGGAPLLSHIPFLLSADGGVADLHLVRSNPIARAVRSEAQARLDVLGPDGYVSPDWYGIDDQVPTWNYVAVSLTGRLEALPPDALEPMLAAQSAAYESRLPKPPWTMEKMTDATRTRFLRMIQPFRLHVDALESTWKLGQNKPEAARHAAAAAVRQGLGHGLAALSELMAQPPDPQT